MAQPEPMAKRSMACSQGVVGAVDRLSALPDGLIHTVFSFLPAPEVVGHVCCHGGGEAFGALRPASTSMCMTLGSPW